jgi:hypothetical protein
MIGFFMNFTQFLQEKFNLDEKNSLNKVIWNKDTLRPDVKKALNELAEEFIKFVDSKELKVVDIIITGSLANYTWHSKSDIDLHIVADLSKVSNKDTVNELFMAKKSLWNIEHSITMKGFPVELYVQPSTDEHTSTGVYSLQTDKWILKPTKQHPKIDDSFVIHKAAQWKRKIDDCVGHCKDIDKIDCLKTRLRDFRQIGLDRDGEFAIENLAYKILRSEGYMDKLYDYAQKIEDDQLSLN